MQEKIYNKNNIEYQSDGYLIIDKEDYYSIKRFKNEFLFTESYNEVNQKDSQKLEQAMGPNDAKYRIKPEVGKLEYVIVYRLDILKSTLDK